MSLLNTEQKIKFQKLFIEKKFRELEFEIESISDFKSRSPFLANLLGVTKLQKKPNNHEDLIEARNCFYNAYSKDPNFLEAICNYANLSLKLGDYNHALEILVEKRKKNYNPKINEVLARIYFIEGEIDKNLELMREIEKNDDLNPPLGSQFLSSLNYSSSFSQEEYLYYCKKIVKKFQITERDKNKLEEFSYNNDLKIGFLSPDFVEHSIYYFFKPLIEQLQKRKIKVFAFNLRDKNYLDSVSEIIKNQCDEWVDLYNLSDLDAANLIRKKKINILVDLVGHFRNNRIGLLKYRAAPLQLSWLGYPNSTGIEEIDYIIADNNLIKSDEKKYYSENVLELKNIWNCHMGLDKNLKVQSPPYLRNGFFTFGCFNNPLKISANCISVWSRILNNTENCKLLIKGLSKGDNIAQKKVLEKFKNQKVDIKKIMFESRKDKKEDHLKMYNNVDVSLDTFPYTGVTTSFESIWMGVPVLTKKGNNFTSRCGESINLNLGLKEFIADTENDYVNKADEIVRNKKYLIDLRSSLRDKSLKTPLFDVNLFGEDFYQLVKSVWERHSNKK